MAKFPDPPINTDFETKGTPLPSLPWEQWFQAISNFLTAPKIPRSTPTSSAARGSVDSITYDANFVYVCVAPNTWKRSTLSSF